ncbi:MAG TPA: aldose 1-epimerase family protein [Bacteroidales bacterium]|nr:aldose 1-epimerase family protein [Bacteroidales bacterium]
MKKEKLLRYVGNQSQLGGTRHYILSDGWGRNMRCIDVDSGSGLRYTILPDRGMDISLASFKGTNLVYLTCNSETHPAFYEPENIGWLRTFNGGLLTTCGLTYLGAPVNDNGEELGLHGRYSTIPAKQVCDLSHWEGEEHIIKIKGTSEEGFMFGNKLRLERELITVAGKNSIHITDTVTNFGFNQSPYTILYHMNLGYPLLDENAELIIDPISTTPRDEVAEKGINDIRKFTTPQPGFKEQVFDHLMKAQSGGMASATLQNKGLGISLQIRFDTSTLPYLVQWKNMGQGDYVLGLEPCNTPGKNRKLLRESNMLPVLGPGESRTLRVEVILNDKF